MTPRSALRPAPQEELLLQAALGEGDEALAAFRRWRTAVDFDRIDASNMRLLPLVVDNLGPRLGDDDVAGRARGVAKFNWAHTQQVQHQMAPVLRELDARSATAMLLKGWALTDSYGGHGWLRTRFDLDLLVPEEHFAEAAESLEGHGMSRDFDVLYGDQQLGDRHAVTFTGPGGLHVDLHRRALVTINQPDADGPFWEAARRIDLQGAPCLVPAPADLLLMVLEHAWRWNPRDSNARWVADAVVLLRCPEPFDWNRLADMSRRYWLGAVVDDALGFLSEDYGTPYPSEVRRRLRHAPLWSRIERRARARPPGDLSRRERAALWLGDALRADVTPGSRASAARIAGAAATKARVTSPALLPAEGLYRLLDRPLGLSRARRWWRPRPAEPECGALPLGERVQVAVGSPWLPVLGEGWSLPERTGVWSDGPEASLRLALPEAEGRPLAVELDLVAFTVPTDERRIIDVVAGKRTATLELLHSSDRPARIPVGRPHGVLELTLIVRNPATPAEHGVDDARRLGVQLQALEVSSLTTPRGGDR